MHTVNLFQMLLLLIANSVYIRKTVTAYNMHIPHTLCNEQQPTHVFISQHNVSVPGSGIARGGAFGA